TSGGTPRGGAHASHLEDGSRRTVRFCRDRSRQGCGMVGPSTSPEEGRGRRSPVLPNPFLVSENPLDADLGSPQTNGSVDAVGHALSSTQQLLENAAPDFGGDYLPVPIPILDFDDESEFSQPEDFSPKAEIENGSAPTFQLRGIKLFSAVFA